MSMKKSVIVSYTKSDLDQSAADIVTEIKMKLGTYKA